MSNQARQDRIRALCEAYIEAAQAKLAGPGDREDQLRSPTEALIKSMADTLGLNAVLHGEVRLVDIKARPDYRVDVGGAPVGYVEIKKPGVNLDPSSFRGHNLRQWEKLRLLPNVLYTNGSEWRLIQSGELVGEAYLPWPKNGRAALADWQNGPSFTSLLLRFLTWKPLVPRSVEQLVSAVANLCQFLRLEVEQTIKLEKMRQKDALFTALAEDWKQLLFPNHDDKEFADHFAQTITFALILSRVEGIDLQGQELVIVAKQLGKKHSVMGKSLAVLTENSDRDLETALQVMQRVIGAVDWAHVRGNAGVKDTFLHLYEDFLASYDPALRESTGSYYTPAAVVRFITTAVHEVIEKRLEKPRGLSNPEVVIVDPAMGTGAFIAEAIRCIADECRTSEGEGAIPISLREAVQRRLVGFEKQSSPFAIAEIRLHELLGQFRTEIPTRGLRLYMADTLDDPYAEHVSLGFAYKALADSRKQADKLKRDEEVVAVLGNPPYNAVGRGHGRWIEEGRPSAGIAPPLDAFRLPGNGRYEYVLSNMHVFFWRWATWKAFDQPKSDGRGVVALVSPAAILHGKGFAGMRKYLRRTASKGWIINLSPEGHEPPKETRTFPGVRQPLCISIFARTGEIDTDQPATVRYIELHGTRADKLRTLTGLDLFGDCWKTTPDGWIDPFLPAGSSIWEESVAFEDIFPWSSRGVTTGRTWVYAPDPATLKTRWKFFTGADTEMRRELMIESRDRTVDSICDSLPGVQNRPRSLSIENGNMLEPERIGYRSFDRQWVIPDHRLMSVARPDLWRVRGNHQVFSCDLHSRPLKSGPAVTFSAFLPDLHFYRGNNGGRCTPLYKDPNAQIPNLNPSLMKALNERLGIAISVETMMAYVAGVASHAAFTKRFALETTEPGLRIPLTADRNLWHRAVELGQELIWLHTYGERFIDPKNGRPRISPKLPIAEQPRLIKAISATIEGMPNDISYDEEAREIRIGDGVVTPVHPDVWNYEISGMQVVKKWFGYRARQPKGKRPGTLSRLVATEWTTTFTSELLELLNVLGRVIAIAPDQELLLTEICDSPRVLLSDLEEVGAIPAADYLSKPPSQNDDPLF